MHSESIKELTGALSKAQVAFKPIKRSEMVDYQTPKGRIKYTYAPLDAVIDATKEALSANGLAVSQITYLQAGNVILETWLIHSSGAWITSELYVAKQDLPPQSLGSALTYMRRYGLSAILNVSSEEDDDGRQAEDDHEEKKEPDKLTEQKHWCSEHNTKFFKTEKMKGYAHPLEGGGWHNEPFPEKPPSQTTITFPKPDFTPEKQQPESIATDTDSDAPEADEGAVTAGEQAGKVSLATSGDLARLTGEMRNAKWDMFRLGKYIKEQGWAVTKTQQLTTAQVDEAIKYILADSVK